MPYASGVATVASALSAKAGGHQRRRSIAARGCHPTQWSSAVLVVTLQLAVVFLVIGLCGGRRWEPPWSLLTFHPTGRHTMVLEGRELEPKRSLR